MGIPKGGRWAARKVQPCGTPAAYRRHLNHREVPCRPCTDAHNAEWHRWNQRRKAREGKAA